MTTDRDAPGAERETARVEAFSDGVFAIAITLLVLELKVPAGLGARGLAAALVAEWPSYAALLVSFATIGIMWVNHHRLFTLIHRVDHGLLMLNGLLLLGVTVVPFPTSLVAAYMGHDGEALAAAVYCGWFVVIAVAFNLLWRYVASPARRPPLLRVALDGPEVDAVNRAYRWGRGWYLVAFILSFWVPAASFVVCGALALFFAIPPRRRQPG